MLSCYRCVLPAIARRCCVAVIALATVFVSGCGTDKNYAKFKQRLGQPHDLQVVRLQSEFHGEPLLPLPLQLDVDAEKAELGERLFHDKRLSVDDSISCASCHDIAAGGSDNRAVALGVDGAEGDINTPTVLNAAFNFAQYWDGRVNSLSAQVEGPVHNVKEMASNWPLVVGKLASDPGYSDAFSQIYPDGISAESITDAIVEFERSLITPSAFDRYLRGEKSAISSQAKQGYALFKNYGCASCHQGINVGGNMFQKFGAVLAHSEEDIRMETESAKAGETTVGEPDSELFKVPSLRNAARTAPYFHNASAATLAQAIDTMGHLQLGRQIPDQDNLKIQRFIESLSAELDS